MVRWTKPISRTGASNTSMGQPREIRARTSRAASWRPSLVSSTANSWRSRICFLVMVGTGWGGVLRVIPLACLQHGPSLWVWQEVFLLILPPLPCCSLCRSRGSSKASPHGGIAPLVLPVARVAQLAATQTKGAACPTSTQPASSRSADLPPTPDAEPLPSQADPSENLTKILKRTLAY